MITNNSIDRALLMFREHVGGTGRHRHRLFCPLDYEARDRARNPRSVGVGRTRLQVDMLARPWLPGLFDVLGERAGVGGAPFHERLGDDEALGLRYEEAMMTDALGLPHQ